MLCKTIVRALDSLGSHRSVYSLIFFDNRERRAGRFNLRTLIVSSEELEHIMSIRHDIVFLWEYGERVRGTGPGPGPRRRETTLVVFAGRGP